MITEILCAGVMLIVLVFLSTIESAYESLSDVSLKLMLAEREESSTASFFRELLEHRPRLELMLVFGTQLSIVAISILFAAIITNIGIAQPLLITFIAAFVVVILFRQLIPRLLAQNRPEEVLWRLLPFFRVFYRFFSVFIAPSAALLRKMRRPEAEVEGGQENQEETLEEIQAFIDVGEEEGIIEESEGELIQTIVEFSDTKVAEVMRPRRQIVAIEASSTIEDARALICESKYSRIPVYRDQIDNIEGIVHVRDILSVFEPEKVSMPITECMRPAYFVPDVKPVAKLLEEMQKAKVQMAIVIDEYGGVAGLVTIEDIVEEIVGEIEDEDRASGRLEVMTAEDGSYLIDGATEIRKVELLFDREIEADDFTTMNGLIISELGHVPATGEKLSLRGLEIEVIEADSRGVNRVRLRTLDEESGAATQNRS